MKASSVHVSNKYKSFLMMGLVLVSIFIISWVIYCLVNMNNLLSSPATLQTSKQTKTTPEHFETAMTFIESRYKALGPFGVGAFVDKVIETPEPEVPKTCLQWSGGSNA